MLIRTAITAPRVAQGLVSITEVVVTPDMRPAPVYISHFGDEAQRPGILEGLHHSEHFLHSELVRRLKMKRVPMVHFKLDPSLERGARLAQLIDQVKNPVNETGRG